MFHYESTHQAKLRDVIVLPLVSSLRREKPTVLVDCSFLVGMSIIQALVFVLKCSRVNTVLKIRIQTSR